jgi:hypothetical protein
VHLAGFDKSDTAALVAARGGQEAADVALAERLCDQTGGDPFFIEELLRSLAEAPDAIGRGPEGVKDVIGRRLDRLRRRWKRSRSRPCSGPISGLPPSGSSRASSGPTT